MALTRRIFRLRLKRGERIYAFKGKWVQKNAPVLLRNHCVCGIFIRMTETEMPIIKNNPWIFDDPAFKFNALLRAGPNTTSLDPSRPSCKTVGRL
jgi:hypothetical protein